jgi:hypothetical protein
MSNYKYICPTEKGFTRVYITRKQHKELLPTRKLGIFHKYEYYLSDDAYQIDRVVSKIGICIHIVAFPFYIPYIGLRNFKELIKEYKEIFNQKELGKFSSDKGFKREGCNFYRNFCIAANYKTNKVM